jgi:hypothetical protein
MTVTATDPARILLNQRVRHLVSNIYVIDSMDDQRLFDKIVSFCCWCRNRTGK